MPVLYYFLVAFATFTICDIAPVSLYYIVLYYILIIHLYMLHITHLYIYTHTSVHISSVSSHISPTLQTYLPSLSPTNQNSVYPKLNSSPQFPAQTCLFSSIPYLGEEPLHSPEPSCHLALPPLMNL